MKAIILPKFIIRIGYIKITQGKRQRWSIKMNEEITQHVRHWWRPRTEITAGREGPGATGGERGCGFKRGGQRALTEKGTRTPQADLCLDGAGSSGRE